MTNRSKLLIGINLAVITLLNVDVREIYTINLIRSADTDNSLKTSVRQISFGNTVFDKPLNTTSF